MDLTSFILAQHVVIIFLVGGILPQLPVHGFIGIKPTKRSGTLSSQLFVDLWDRMEIEEDDEHEWYLLNCVAGLEMDLLSQCRISVQSMPSEDVVKFVVPTVTETRSHGANRMLRETKVKYQGYVFAKLRLTKQTYTTVQQIPLVRSWMGTINVKGHKKLPPAPIPLSEDEIRSFDLENVNWEEDEHDESNLQDDTDIIVDTVENDLKDTEEEEAIANEVNQVYKDLKVEDMIKVTAKNKFFGEDGIVRRLKNNKILIRFYTYGTMYEEWLDPIDVRKLTEIEIAKGLGGPGAPITQRDLDGPKDNNRRNRDDPRNQVGTFGRSASTTGTRNRRQDRIERSYQKDSFDRNEGRDNWNQFKENEKRFERRSKADRSYDDGDGVVFNAGSEDQGKDFWAESDVDSQWGRNNRSRQQQNTGSRKERPSNHRTRDQKDDWNSFVSKSSPTGKTKRNRNSNQSASEDDDFFSSLLSSLSKDMDMDDDEGRKRDRNSVESAEDSDDDFFASLMSEIENDASDNTRLAPSKRKESNGDNDDDFFASLEREIRGSSRRDISEPKVEEKKEETFDDNFFASLGKEMENSSSNNAPKLSIKSDEDDFFANLEMELASDLDDVSISKDNKSDDDDFFSSLEAELRSDLDTKENESIDASPLNNLQSNQSNERTEEWAGESFEKHSAEKKEIERSLIKSTFDAADLQKRTVPELKNILRDRGMKVSGKKAQLIDRITTSD